MASACGLGCTLYFTTALAIVGRLGLSALFS